MQPLGLARLFAVSASLAIAATLLYDCFFSGESKVVNESCADVRLRIR